MMMLMLLLQSMLNVGVDDDRVDVVAVVDDVYKKYPTRLCMYIYLDIHILYIYIYRWAQLQQNDLLCCC